MTPSALADFDLAFRIAEGMINQHVADGSARDGGMSAA
jgi:hypothetical protein